MTHHRLTSHGRLFPLIILIFLLVVLPLILRISKTQQNTLQKASEDLSVAFSPPEETIRENRISPPTQIYAIRFLYQKDEPVQFQIVTVTRQQGYIPTQEEQKYGYRLSLINQTESMLYSQTFIPPIMHEDPPPLDQVTPFVSDSAVIPIQEFVMNIPYFPEAVQVKLYDEQDKEIAAFDLKNATIKQTKPSFRSIPGNSLPSSLLNRIINSVQVSASSGNGYVDLTFIGDKYNSTQLSQFRNEAAAYAAHLLTYEPFKSRTDKILFHFVDNTTNLGCMHDSATVRLIVCNNATVVQQVNDAQAPYDKIIVLINDPEYGGSGGGTVATSYNGSWGSQVTVHELGHTFGGLHDEYNLFTTNGSLDNRVYMNCYAGTPPAPAWNGIVPLQAYTLGCRYPNWYRSTPTSVMLELSSYEFNPVSQAILSQKIDIYTQTTVTPTPTASPTLTPPLTGPVLGNGDANTDGSVNNLDLRTVLNNYLSSLTSPIDQFKDGRINIMDFVRVVKQLP
jgi:hypothetical protein